LDEVRGVAVDPARKPDCGLELQAARERPEFFVFPDRTDEGDVLPKAIIAGP